MYTTVTGYSLVKKMYTHIVNGNMSVETIVRIIENYDTYLACELVGCEWVGSDFDSRDFSIEPICVRS